MIIALTAWQNRISPVYDASRTLFIAHISEGKVIGTSLETFNPEIRYQLMEMLTLLKIDVLICGGISEDHANIIESSGITLIPFICGRIEEILEVYLKENRITLDFMMPGCGRRRRKRAGGIVFENHRGEVKKMPKGKGKQPQGQRGRGRGQGQGQGAGGGNRGGRACRRPEGGKGSVQGKNQNNKSGS